MNQEEGQLFLSEIPDIDTDLPFSPTLLQKLFIQTSDGSMASLEEIADTMARDQGLTAKVLSLANSAFYGLQAQVSTVARAIAVLGLREIKNIVLALGVKALAGKGVRPPEFDLASYWRHQVTTALGAKAVATMTKDVPPDSLFTAGLLHDLGKLITAMHRPKQWLAITRASAQDNLPFSQAEEDYWGLDHGVIGALVLKSWDLPPEITEPVNWHHCPEAAPDFQDHATALAAADALAHKIANPESPEAHPLDKCLDLLELDHDMVEHAMAKALDQEAVDRFVRNLM